MTGLPAERYGVRRPLARRRPWTAAAVAAALTVAVGLAWWAAQAREPAVRHRLLTYRVLSDTSVEIRWEVTRADAVRVTCVLRARDRANTEVGRQEVAIPAGGDRTLDLTRVLATSARANLGEVQDCRPG